MRSITWRLTLWYTAILMVIIIVCGTAAFWGMRYFVFTKANQEMQTSMAAVKKFILSQGQNGEYKSVNLDDPTLTASSESGILWVQITTSDGRVLNSSQNLGNAVLSPGYTGPAVLVEPRKHEREMPRKHEKEMLLAGTELTKDTTVQVAFTISREEHFLEILASILGLLTFGGLALAVVGGWIITRKALKPIKSLTIAARQISTTDLSCRIALNGPRDELYTLAETFNRMLDRLEKGFRSQQEFVAAASHDLRTPLTIIKSYTDLLKRWGKDDRAVMEESVQAMAKAVGVMERLVNDLLLLARMQARPSFNIMPLSLGELVEETVREARALSEDINITVDITEQAIVAADEYYLRRALWVLVDNALKYNRPGGEVTVSVTVNKNRGQAILSVDDNGPGIDREDLPKIFDRFYRGDPARSQGKGFGLGLSLAKEIVEAHHGAITVDSQPDKGSRFTIVLPLRFTD